MVLDRGSLKRESKMLLKTAQVSPYLFTLVLLAIMFVINGISDYVQMDDEFAYVYSLRFDMDLSFLALHRAFPAFAVWFVSIVCTLLGVVLNVGASLYHLGIRRGEEMPFVTLFDGFAFAGKVILLFIVQYIFILLWTFLLVIPGIVAAYRYRFAMLNLCENPEIGVMEALNMSKAQTLGFKWQLFVLDLSFIGAVTKRQMIGFIPMNVEVAASTFENIQRFAEELEKDGIDDFDITLQGSINGGMQFRIPQKLKIEKSMGGAEGYKTLADYLEDGGNKLYLDVDFTKVYRNGNGLDTSSQIARFISNNTAVLSGYSPANGERDPESSAHLINPLSFDYIIGKFKDAAEDALI